MTYEAPPWFESFKERLTSIGFGFASSIDDPGINDAIAHSFLRGDLEIYVIRDRSPWEVRVGFAGPAVQALCETGISTRVAELKVVLGDAELMTPAVDAEQDAAYVSQNIDRIAALASDRIALAKIEQVMRVRVRNFRHFPDDLFQIYIASQLKEAMRRQTSWNEEQEGNLLRDLLDFPAEALDQQSRDGWILLCREDKLLVLSTRKRR